MENRLCLNKKPVYELPDEVLIGEYRYSKNMKQYKEPNFEPDLCVSSYGTVKVRSKKDNCLQIWIKTNNKDLINFIANFDWKSKTKTMGNNPVLNIWKFKKIILEEFYGVKYGK